MIEASTFAATISVLRAMSTQEPNMTVPEVLDNAEDVFKTLSGLVEKSLAQLSAEDLATAMQDIKVEAVEPQRPAVPIEDSVQNDYIVCLEDGSHHKMMKRYLKRVYGMTPEQYRQKWDLPNDYPVVAPGYSAQKAAEAHAVGLGHHENKRGAARLDEQNEQVLAA